MLQVRTYWCCRAVQGPATARALDYLVGRWIWLLMPQRPAWVAMATAHNFMREEHWVAATLPRWARAGGGPLRKRRPRAGRPRPSLNYETLSPGTGARHHPYFQGLFGWTPTNDFIDLINGLNKT